MDVLNRNDVKDLLNAGTGKCISIYMPTFKAGAETRQGPIRLKNILARMREQLKSWGMKSAEVKELVKPVEELVLDDGFWQRQDKGLALFLSSEEMRTYRLPVHFDERLIVSDQFHITPLLPVIQEDGIYYILAISQNQVRLLEASRFMVSEIELSGVPTNLQEALQYDDIERETQLHVGSGPSTSPGGQGGHSPLFHGHGVGSEDTKKNILRFFQKLDDGVTREIQPGSAPLVMAGVEYLLPIYRQANTYPHLARETVHGNPETWTGSQLQEKTLDKLDDQFSRDLEEALENARRLIHAENDQASTDLAEIFPAAADGRVDTLFVDPDAFRWGAYDPAERQISVHDRQQPGDTELLNGAAAATLLNGGKVFAVVEEDLPGEEPVAAVFRF